MAMRQEHNPYNAIYGVDRAIIRVYAPRKVYIGGIEGERESEIVAVIEY